MLKKVVILFTPAFSVDKHKSFTIPYAMLSLERSILSLNIDILHIDEQIIPDYFPLIDAVKDRLLLAAVTSSTGPQITQAIRFSKYLKQHCPDARIVWGGWHASLMPEQTLKADFVDYVIYGQGEAPFRHLVSSLMHKTDLKDTDGICFKENGKLIIDLKNCHVQQSDLLPIDYSSIDVSAYLFKFANYNRTLNYFSSQGCPYYCGFCAVATVYKRHWFPKSNDTVIKDLIYFKKHANNDSIFFWDENFFIDKTKTLSLCQAIINEGLDIKWDAWVHAAHFVKNYDKKDVELMYNAGLRRLFAGAESGNNEVLKLIEKNQNRADLFDFLNLIKPFSIVPVFSMIICFPMDPQKDLKDSLDLLREGKMCNKQLMAIFSYFTPYPGTKLYNLAKENGFIEPTSLEGWATHCLSDFNSPWIIKDKIKRIEYFDKFYMMFANPAFYRWAPSSVRWLVYPLNKLIYPFIYLRFRYNFFKFPIDAFLFIQLLKIINILSKHKYKTGNHRRELN